MNWGILVYALTAEAFGSALFPFLTQSAVEADSKLGLYVSLAILVSFMVSGVGLTLMGTVKTRPVDLFQAKGLIGMSSILALVFLVAVFWSEAIRSDTIAACPSVSYSGHLSRCEFLLVDSLLPFIYG